MQSAISKMQSAMQGHSANNLFTILAFGSSVFASCIVHTYTGRVGFFFASSLMNNTCVCFKAILLPYTHHLSKLTLAFDLGPTCKEKGTFSNQQTA